MEATRDSAMHLCLTFAHLSQSPRLKGEKSVSGTTFASVHVSPVGTTFASMQVSPVIVYKRKGDVYVHAGM